jgi:hypothetical protein
MLFDRKYAFFSRTTRTLVRDWSILHPWPVLPSATDFDGMLGVTSIALI